MNTYSIGIRAAQLAARFPAERLRVMRDRCITRLGIFDQHNAPQFIIAREADMAAVRRAAYEIAIKQEQR